MPRQNDAQWNNAIGRLEAGVSQFLVARDFNVAETSTPHFWSRYQLHDSTINHRASRPRMTSTALDRLTRLRNLR